MHSFISLSIALFILLDPVGNIPLFLSILKDVSHRRQKVIIFRELCIALAVILTFAFVGNSFLQTLKITEDAVLISGGIILFLIALKMIFPNMRNGHTEKIREKEPFIVPLAIPLTAGPAVLAAVMLYARQETNQLILISAIVVAWAVSTVILLASSFLKKLLGDRGVTACERLMGLLLTLIAVQMFLKGLELYPHVQH